ncbi:hypothetical protein DPMN_119597 [Dreissena polymorpha]|uniref:Uncharacterized protein n=1 Tax=Dreissena polymorpha TaxID=45954 RepID=A0A9D4GQ79_DREPO|nr:hypothetical protein DPMN_119597 [Dreissena polymorpha]
METDKTSDMSKRSIEKFFMRYKSDLSSKVYKGVANIYSAELSRVKDEYYKDKIADAEGNTRKLYAITSDLLG